MSNSELICNADGSIYHLGLHPAEVSDIVITVGDPERVTTISDHFDTVELKRSRREFVTHTGNYRGKRLSVISTGIGTDNIDIVLNELHALRLIDPQNAPTFKFIRLGTSGAVRPDIEVDSILASSAAIGMDGLLHYYEYPDDSERIDALIQNDAAWALLPRPYLADGSKNLLKIFKSMCHLEGVTLTAPGFYAPQGRSVTAKPKVENFTKLLSKSSLMGQPVTNIEMETAGIYGLSTLLGHQAISISAILANRYNGLFSKNPGKTVALMIDKALDIIARMD